MGSAKNCVGTRKIARFEKSGLHDLLEWDEWYLCTQSTYDIQHGAIAIGPPEAD
jgi:hypothetical protein